MKTTLKNVLSHIDLTLSDPYDFDKDGFKKTGRKFLKDICKEAGVIPDKGYPKFNPGGHAVYGDHYLTLSRESDDVKLEFIIGDMGLLYRTRVGKTSNFGTNVWPPEDVSNEYLVNVILNFLN